MTKVIWPSPSSFHSSSSVRALLLVSMPDLCEEPWMTAEMKGFSCPPWKPSLRRRCFAWCPPQCQSCWWSVETDEDCPRCTADPGLAHHWCTIHGTSSSLDSEREKIYFIKNSLTWQNNNFTNKGDSHKCFNIFRSCFNQNERRKKKYIYLFQ